jgi:hypothetical protein
MSVTDDPGMSVTGDLGMSVEIPAPGGTREETPFPSIQVAKLIP